MSKMQLHNRLKNLFDEFEPVEEKTVPIDPGQPKGNTAGWSWACNSNGEYTSCGPEVQAILGIQPHEFINQQFNAFALTPASSSKLQTVLLASQFPCEVVVDYETRKGTPRPTRLNIYQSCDEANHPTGWYGFAEQLKQVGKPKAIPRIEKTSPDQMHKGEIAPLPVVEPQRVNLDLQASRIPLSDAGKISIQNEQFVHVPASSTTPAAMALPIQVRQQTLGFLEVIDGKNQANWSDDDRLLISEVANQLSLALENAQLYATVQQELAERIHAEEETLRRNQDLSTLNQIGQELNKVTNPKELFEILSGLIGQVIDTSNLIIALYDQSNERLSFPVYWIDGQVQSVADRPLGNGILEHVLKTKEVLIITEHLANNLNELGITPVGRIPASILAVPLISGENVLGVILCQNYLDVKAYTPIQADLLSTIATQAAIALQNAHLLDDTQKRALELQTAAEIARDTSGTLELFELFKRVVNMLCARFGFYQAAIFLIDETGSYIAVGEATGAIGEEMKRQQYKVDLSTATLLGNAILNQKPMAVNDIHIDRNYLPNPFLPDSRSELVVPLTIGTKVIGGLDVHSTQPSAFGVGEITVLQILADQIAVAIENARAYELSQQAVREMQEADRIKNQFLANMSHELRTPLNSIIGFSRVILKGIDGPVSELQEQDLSAIYHSGQHLLTLINDILDLSRIDAGKMELNLDEVNISDMVNSVMSTAVGLVKDKPIQLVKEIDPTIPLVKADPTRVRQVLINFLSNAAKFTEEGQIGVTAKIIKTASGLSEVYLGVTDNGPGIAPEDQAKLFQRFSQVDDSPTRKSGGTGLGLSICKSLIEMHKGQIGVNSEVGHGSTFWFTLPLPETESAESLPDNAQQSVLCIEDDPQVINLYERYLTGQNLTIVPLTDATKALEYAKKVKPFVITLDVMMPNKDGWHILSELKRDPETSLIPVIMCTILEDQDKGFNLGATDYLVKPFSQDDLVNSINRLNLDGSIRDILVIDDDPNDLRLVQKTLEQDGKYQVTLANGGVDGWTKINEKPPHAVILDIFMADMDGFTLINMMKSTENLKNIPVIILTGADLTPEQHEQLATISESMLAKGLLKEDDLLASLEKSIRNLQPGPVAKP